MTHVKDTLDSMAVQQQQLIAQQQRMLLELTKYRGLFGGVSLLAAAIVTCLTLAKDWLVDIFR